MQIENDDLSVELPDFQAQLKKIESTDLEIEEMMKGRVRQKDSYTVYEVAELLGKVKFTVREYCRRNRIFAAMRARGRIVTKEWIVSADEVERIGDEGLLPLLEESVENAPEFKVIAFSRVSAETNQTLEPKHCVDRLESDAYTVEPYLLSGVQPKH